MTVLCYQGEEVDTAFIKTSLLERLADDNLGVVSEVLSFEDVSFCLWKCISYSGLKNKKTVFTGHWAC